MLDFARLQTPPRDGDVLVAPDPQAMAHWARANHTALRHTSAMLMGRPLAQWRRETRTALVGDDERLVIVLGHQPEFIHPGVWAKHVVAQRMARALDGVAINLVVDNDTPKQAALIVPTVKDGTVRRRSIPYAEVRPGYAFEQLRGLSRDEAMRFSTALRTAMGARLNGSQMPAFLAAISSAVAAGDSGAIGLVEQSLAGRRAIERKFGIELEEHRVSSVAYSPLLVDIVQNAKRFRSSYNRALARYRRSERIRGVDRPMPDLMQRGGAVETPVWVYRRCERRRRLFVDPQRDQWRLLADQDEIGSVSTDDLSRGDRLRDRMAALGGWQLRPRALTLTLWARLLLADLFIHGIGGAKYDRITDEIMVDYFGLEPPGMACVSATLWPDLPRTEVDEAAVRQRERVLRDVRCNPQRHVAAEGKQTELIVRREEAVRLAKLLAVNAPGDHRARRAAFRRIRECSASLLAARSDLVRKAEAGVEAARAALRQNEIARGRDYFFGLFDDRALNRLLDALPPELDFTV